jgi:hypothetical protein
MTRNLKYILVLLLSCAALLSAVAVVNYSTDTYGIYTSQGRRFFGHNYARAKAYGIEALRPSTVLLGTSRVQWGFKAGGETYNYGFGGSSLDIMAGQVRNLARLPTTRRFWIELDFPMFEEGDHPTADYEEPRLPWLVAGRGPWWKDRWYSLFSFDALYGSYIQWRNKPFFKNLDSHGYEDRAMEALSPDQWDRFDLSHFRHQLLRGMKKPFQWDMEQGRRWKSWRALLSAMPKEKNGSVFFIAPFHARNLEMIRAAGLEDFYRQWKRRVVKEAGEAGFTVLDFSGYGPIQSAPLPRGGASPYYYESSHIRPALGELVQRDLEQPRQAKLGVLLDAETLKKKEQEDRAGAEKYRKERKEDLGRLLGEIQESVRLHEGRPYRLR